MDEGESKQNTSDPNSIVLKLRRNVDLKEICKYINDIKPPTMMGLPLITIDGIQSDPAIVTDDEGNEVIRTTLKVKNFYFMIEFGRTGLKIYLLEKEGSSTQELTRELISEHDYRFDTGKLILDEINACMNRRQVYEVARADIMSLRF